MRTILAVATKEFHQILRDRRTLTILVLVPAMILLLYGYALNFDIRGIGLAVQDRDRSPRSRELVSAFVNSGYFELVGYVDSDKEIEALVDRNRARTVLVIPPRFERDVATRQPVTVQVVIDGDNANSASTAMGYAQAIVAEFGATVVGGATASDVVSGFSRTLPAEDSAASGLPGLSGVEGPGPSAVEGSQTMPLTLEPRIWYNPQLRSTLFLVPGLIAFISTITAVVSTTLSVVREKERGTMEQIRMAPVGPLAFILGKTVPYLVLSFISALLIIFTAQLLFDMPMRGSWAMLCAAIVLFLIGAQGQGLLISTIAESQQVAFQVALLSSFLPTFILSGFIFPLSSMPWIVQTVSLIIPARYFLRVLRAIVLKGAGIEAFWPQLVALAVFSTITIGLASLRLRREWA